MTLDSVARDERGAAVTVELQTITLNSVARCDREAAVRTADCDIGQSSKA